MKKRTLIILFTLAVVVIGGLIAWDKIQKNNPDYSGKKPDYSLTATELVAAFDKDTAGARSKYLEKILEVTGQVIRVDSLGSIELGLEGSPSSVTVSLDEKRHKDDYKKVKQGGTYTVQGKCSGYRKSGGDPDDLLASLGTTVELNFAGVKEKQ